MDIVEQQKTNLSQKRDRYDRLGALGLFALAFYAVFALNRTYFRYFNEIIQLPTRYSVPSIVAVSAYKLARDDG